MSMTKTMSIHIEQNDGLNHLAWCLWEHNRYSQWPDGISLLSADKVSQSSSIRPQLIEIAEAEKPDDIVHLWACEQAKRLADELAGCTRIWMYSLGGINMQIPMDEDLLAQGKDIVSQDMFKIPMHLRFTPDLIFDEGFEGCILQGDVVRHDDTTLLLSKACAIGAVYIADIIGARWE